METVELDNVQCIGETARALLVRLDDGAEHWVPKSVVHGDSEVYESGHEGTLVLEEWFAVREGLA
jgi:hypothetical protein